MDLDKLAQIANAMVASNKGLLAADESTGTITKRFDTINVESTEETRRDYRELLFRTPDIGQYISGVILFDETIRQSAADGTPLVDLLEKRGVIAGIKVDAGAKPLAGSENEMVTEGLDGLRERVAEYRDFGAKFAKWRAVIKIGDEMTSGYAIHVNAHALAKACAFTWIAYPDVISSPILITARHLANFAPKSRYSATLSRRPSSPSVTISFSEPANGLAPASTLMPAITPRFSNKSTKGVPSAAD